MLLRLPTVSKMVYSCRITCFLFRFGNSINFRKTISKVSFITTKVTSSVKFVLSLIEFISSKFDHTLTTYSHRFVTNEVGAPVKMRFFLFCTRKKEYNFFNNINDSNNLLIIYSLC